MNLGRNPQSAAIVRAVIGLGHGLEMSIVGEGVETQDQLAFLSEAGCDAVQAILSAGLRRLGNTPSLSAAPVAMSWSQRARPGRGLAWRITIWRSSAVG
jgi:EAL domain-containing protein (putative c-di-GMP-specific phosphodiesterase class I)